jgi:uncharacterized protein HemX
MPEITNSELEKHIKNWNLRASAVAVLGAILTAASIGYGFYYNTKSQLKQNTENIKEIKTDVEEINDKITNTTVFQNVSEVEMNHFQDRLQNLEQSQDRMENKVDKVLEILANHP